MNSSTATSAEFRPDNPTNPTALRLIGLDGTNPLGFLAAVGLFRVVSRSLASTVVKLGWVATGGTWIPELSGATLTPAGLLNLLSASFSAVDEHPSLSLLANATKQSSPSGPEQVTRRMVMLNRLSGISRENVESADWIAAVISDAVPEDSINQLQTVRRDYFTGNIRSVVDRTHESHLERTIFSPWDYADALDNQSLHLDPTEDRRHAHQWDKPSGDPNRKNQGGMLGANRLALEAFPLFVSIPAGDALRTLSFSGQRSTNTRWTWPIWSEPIDIDSMRSVLGFQELQKLEPTPADVSTLRGRGITAAFRTWRILVGKTPNFTPPERIA